MTDPTPNEQTWVCRVQSDEIEACDPNDPHKWASLDPLVETGCGPVPPAPSSDEAAEVDPQCCQYWPNGHAEDCPNMPGWPAPSSDTPSDDDLDLFIPLRQSPAARHYIARPAPSSSPVGDRVLDVTALPEWDALRAAAECGPLVRVAVEALRLLAAADRGGRTDG